VDDEVTDNNFQLVSNPKKKVAIHNNKFDVTMINNSSASLGVNSVPQADALSASRKFTD
jgi:hypothetical protein